MNIISALLAFMMAFAVWTGTASAQCRLCSEPAGSAVSSAHAGSTQSEKPLRIEITADLDFSRLALMSRSGGEVSIDPLSGQRRISGGITDLGGMSLHGQGRLEGEPGRYVSVNLPDRITLSAPNGSTAELVKLETNLPVRAKLDSMGQLTFSFGGKLQVTGNANGQFRGRISITADYE